MEFEGKVIQILPATSGTSARGEWHKQEVIFEIPSEFSRKVCVVFFNKQSEVARMQVGAQYVVSFNIESREYNGRWYTDIRAWRLQAKQQEAPAAAAPMPDFAPMPAEPSYATAPTAEVDDLPF